MQNLRNWPETAETRQSRTPGGRPTMADPVDVSGHQPLPAYGVEDGPGLVGPEDESWRNDPYKPPKMPFDCFKEPDLMKKLAEPRTPAHTAQTRASSTGIPGHPRAVAAGGGAGRHGRSAHHARDGCWPGWS